MEARALRLFWALAAAAALWLTAAPRPSSAGTCRQVHPAADSCPQTCCLRSLPEAAYLTLYCWRRDALLLHVQGPGSATRFCALPERLGNFQGALGGTQCCHSLACSTLHACHAKGQGCSGPVAAMASGSCTLQEPKGESSSMS